MFAGLSLALLTGVGFYFVYIKLPKRIQRFLEKHMLLTEIVSSLLTYWLFGGTVTALFAAAWLGIIQSIVFLMLTNKDARYVLDSCMLQLAKVTNSVKEWILEEARKIRETNEGLDLNN